MARWPENELSVLVFVQMRFLVSFAVFAFLVAAVNAWTKEDHEIFDLVSALEGAEGKGTTFYSWLDVSPSATSAEIGRSYRKKSVVLHPDKNQGVKGAHERFARLGVIAQILRSPEGRERYDFFYKNGVPKWRGTGYYYSRYRPGLGSVAVFLVVVTSGLHYLIQRLNYKSEIERIERFVHDARLAAWGSKMIPIDGRRKVKVNIGGRSYTDDEGNVINGKWLDMVVEGDAVYILEPNGDLLSLDSGAATPPSLSRTWFIALTLSWIRIGKSKLAGRESQDADDVQDSGRDDDGSESGSGAQSLNGEPAVVRGPTVKAGGRRRKGVAAKKKSSNS